MFRSCTRLDDALPLATALLILSLASSADAAGGSTSVADPELSGATQTCQASTPADSTANTTQPATDEAADDDFFSWIKKMTEPTTTGSRQNPAAPTRPRGNRDNGNHGDGGHGGGAHGGGQGGGGQGH